MLEKRIAATVILEALHSATPYSSTNYVAGKPWQIVSLLRPWLGENILILKVR